MSMGRITYLQSALASLSGNRIELAFLSALISICHYLHCTGTQHSTLPANKSLGV